MAVSFVANANHGRGTTSLLLQSLRTGFLGIYTTLHFDIHVQTPSKWAFLVRKTISLTILFIASYSSCFPSMHSTIDTVRECSAKPVKRVLILSRHDLSMKQIHCLPSGGGQISSSTEDHKKALKIELLVFVDQVKMSRCFKILKPLFVLSFLAT